jgi:hypothetical protein
MKRKRLSWFTRMTALAFESMATLDHPVQASQLHSTGFAQYACGPGHLAYSQLKRRASGQCQNAELLVQGA